MRKFKEAKRKYIELQVGMAKKTGSIGGYEVCAGLVEILPGFYVSEHTATLWTLEALDVIEGDR